MFTQNEYISFLELINKTTDTFLFSDFDWESPGLILRHDVDISIDNCLNLVRLEKNAGVVSTCFIMVTSDLYNPLSQSSTKAIREISGSGFEVGLHFDPTCYPEASIEKLQHLAKLEATLLESITQKKVTSISLHCPSVHGMFPKFDDFVNAYDPQLFSNENYLSDSCKSFRGKDPYKWLEMAKTRPIQMLFHPLHYQHEKSGYDIIFETIINKHISNFNKQFSLNPTFKKELGELPSYKINT